MPSPASFSPSMNLSELPPLTELIDGLPNLSGWESEVSAVVRHERPVYLDQTNIRLEAVSAAFAVALHMHQPLIPAGEQGELISNLQYMFEHPYEGDNHNAGPFSYCYSRIANFIPQLISQGCNPRIMLDYSGNLLWGLRQMGRGDILNNLKRITCSPAYQPYVEWLGTMWSHAVVSSTPMPDIRLHVQAWQHHFAAIFGWEALARVKGFSLPEMHLPNHPDTLFELVRVLKNCGYRWLLVQEQTIESLQGGAIANPHIPHKLVARSSNGDTVSITALIKTQGSDTKLVGHMQPYYTAKTLPRQTLSGISVPPLVTQISDGENGGVMMNEFPGYFNNAWHEMQRQGGGTAGVVGLNGTEYLELIEAAGCDPDAYPACQAAGQHWLWQQIGAETASAEAIAQAVETIQHDQPDFHMEGSSWTNHMSWVKGYGNILTPINRLSARFHQIMQPLWQQEAAAPEAEPLTRQLRYRNALMHHLLLQTSCFRYWGQGTWTDYAREINRRAEEILRHDF